MSTVVDLFVLYKIIRKLVTPFTSMYAYQMNLIDSNGNFLKSRDKMTSLEKDALTYLDVFVINIKKILAKIPGGRSQLATFAAAMLLLRQTPISESVSSEQLEKDLLEQMRILEEETSVGSGAIAGMGVGEKGEPGLTAVQMKKYKKKNSSNNIVNIIKRVRR